MTESGMVTYNMALQKLVYLAIKNIEKKMDYAPAKLGIDGSTISY
jgi:hypothetical protein